MPIRELLPRRVRRSCVAVLVTTCVLTGCTGTQPGGSPATPQAPPVARISASPADGTTNVPVTRPLLLRVERGALTEVVLTNAAGKRVPGELAADQRSWRSSVLLGYGKRYTYRAGAVGTDDKRVEIAGAFRTVVPDSVNRATINPVDDAEVGVAMPVSINFDAPVTDKAAVERRLTVRTSAGRIEGSWAWLSDTKVDYRPREYWPANTDVAVRARLYGVPYGGGAYGRSDLSTRFRVGREQIVRINTPEHAMHVYRGGAKTASYPASNGEDADVNRNTPNGTFIVMEKQEVGNFSNPQYGYTDVLKKWAVRFSNHGEFIHENEENRANIGSANTSHGCVNLTDADAKEYFDSALIGDPVEISGSKLSLEPRYEVYDWLLEWSAWRSMSALR